MSKKQQSSLNLFFQIQLLSSFWRNERSDISVWLKRRVVVWLDTFGAMPVHKHLLSWHGCCNPQNCNVWPLLHVWHKLSTPHNMIVTPSKLQDLLLWLDLRAVWCIRLHLFLYDVHVSSKSKHISFWRMESFCQEISCLCTRCKITKQNGDRKHLMI